MFPRRPLKILLSLVVVVGALLAADVGARTVAQNELAQRAQSASGARSASAGISGFPFLVRLLAQGLVPGVDLRMTGVPVGALRLHSVDVQLAGIVVDRAALFSARQVHVKSIAAATATVTVTADELSSAVGQTVSIPGNGQVLVDVAGHMVSATVQVLGGHVLTVSVGGVPLLSSDLGQSPLVPSCPLALSVGNGQVVVSCHVQPVPLRLIDAISGAA
ncbi:MAG: hypothetical protein ACYDD6_12120 [Acidimicrobiales bacterium]